MSSDRDVARIVRSWLDEGATALPDRVLDVVLDQVPATPQRRATWWPARRFPGMNNPIRLATIGVALLVVVLVVLVLRPSSTFGPLASATPTTTPVSTPVAFELAIDGGGIPGALVLDAPFPLRVEFDVPARWSATEVTAGRATLQMERGAAASVWVDFFVVDNVYPDPCHIGDGPMSPPVGPTVDEFVAAVTGAPGFEVSGLGDVTLDGRPGKSFGLTNDVETVACDGDPWLQQWTHAGGGDDGGVYGTVTAAREQFWVVDDDGTRLVILVTESGEPTPAEVDQARGIVNSVRFE